MSKIFKSNISRI